MRSKYQLSCRGICSDIPRMMIKLNTPPLDTNWPTQHCCANPICRTMTWGSGQLWNLGETLNTRGCQWGYQSQICVPSMQRLVQIDHNIYATQHFTDHKKQQKQKPHSWSIDDYEKDLPLCKPYIAGFVARAISKVLYCNQLIWVPLCASLIPTSQILHEWLSLTSKSARR